MSREPLWKLHRKQLDTFYKAAVNFDLERTHEYTEETGWNIDDYEAELPPEPPGPPIPHGSFRIGQAIIREYKFPDPGIVTGIYYPDRPLEERVMILQARFLFFTFHFGVRVGGTIDEIRETDAGKEQVWGFYYQTLEGHFEQGQMTFEIAKNLETGQVRFRIHAFSRTGTIDNIFYRIGFKLFGRSLQRKFALRSLERMQELVKEQLSAAVHDEPAPPVEAPPIRSASESKGAEKALEQVEEEIEERDSAPG